MAPRKLLVCAVTLPGGAHDSEGGGPPLWLDRACGEPDVHRNLLKRMGFLVPVQRIPLGILEQGFAVRGPLASSAQTHPRRTESDDRQTGRLRA